jgi:hypothetical protein
VTIPVKVYHHSGAKCTTLPNDDLVTKFTDFFQVFYV